MKPFAEIVGHEEVLNMPCDCPKDGQIHYNISDKFYQDPNDKVLGGGRIRLGTTEYLSGAKAAYIVSVFLRGKAFVTDRNSNFPLIPQLHFLRPLADGEV